MRISDWSSDVCSSDLKWFVNGRAICRYGIRRRERGSDRRISGATGRSRVARSGLMPHGDAVGERSEEHTSELQSLMRISYAVFCLKKKNRYTYSKDSATS